MVLVNRNVAPSFNTIIEILQNDQRKIKLIRKYENTRKKIINNECAILFNKTCIDEGLLPKSQFYFFAGQIKKISFFGKPSFSVGRTSIMRIIRRKLKIWLHNVVRNSMQIPNVSLLLFYVIVLALIVFDFHSFEISKINNQKT